MSTNYLAWSHSRMNQFLECPKQLYHNAVAPKGSADHIEFTQTPQMIAGNLVDDALTKRISQGTPLPSQYAPYEPMVAAILAAPGVKFAQLKVTLDRTFKPCGYFDAGAWVRSIYDVAVINGDYAFIGDFKNGMIWPDTNQLKLFAATAFHQFPELETIDTGYIWLKHGQTSDETFRRKELNDLWQVFIPDEERMQACYQTGHWPASPKRGAKSCERCNVNKSKLCSAAQAPYKG